MDNKLAASLLHICFQLFHVFPHVIHFHGPFLYKHLLGKAEVLFSLNVYVCPIDMFCFIGHPVILLWHYLFDLEPFITAPKNPDIKLLFESYPGIMCCSAERLAL